MPNERSDEGARIYGRSEDTAGKEIRVQAQLKTGEGAKTWLIINGPTLGLDIAGAKRLIAALAAFIDEAASSGTESAGPELVDLPEPVRERFGTLIQRTIAVADEWRDYARMLPEGPSKNRAISIATAVYVERTMSALPLADVP